jgi:hypothetical protein
MVRPEAAIDAFVASRRQFVTGEVPTAEPVGASSSVGVAPTASTFGLATYGADSPAADSDGFGGCGSRYQT